MRFRIRSNRIVWLAGDSTLDNKYWVSGKRAARNGYEKFISPPFVRPDVCFHLNDILKEKNICAVAINTAVEGSTLQQRNIKLLDHDMLIRNQIRNSDDLVISVGGNDFALSPTIHTLTNLFLLSYASHEAIENGTAWGLASICEMIRSGLQNYVDSLTELQKPRRILICSLYYPDKNPESHGWADGILKRLGTRVDLLIRAIYREAVCKVVVKNSHVIYVPLFETLNGLDSSLYSQRVEPSSKGGRKIAHTLTKYL